VAVAVELVPPLAMGSVPVTFVVKLTTVVDVEPVPPDATGSALVKVTTCAVLMLNAVVATPPAVVVCNANAPSLAAVVFNPALPLVTPLSDRMVDGMLIYLYGA
jgi:hypothetical protein